MDENLRELAKKVDQIYQAYEKSKKFWERNWLSWVISVALVLPSAIIFAIGLYIRLNDAPTKEDLASLKSEMTNLGNYIGNEIKILGDLKLANEKIAQLQKQINDFSNGFPAKIYPNGSGSTTLNIPVEDFSVTYWARPANKQDGFQELSDFDRDFDNKSGCFLRASGERAGIFTNEPREKNGWAIPIHHPSYLLVFAHVNKDFAIPGSKDPNHLYHITLVSAADSGGTEWNGCRYKIWREDARKAGSAQ